MVLFRKGAEGVGGDKPPDLDRRIGPKGPPPQIRRERSRINLGARIVEVDRVLGRTEYRLIAPPAGSTVEVKVLVDGKEWAELGPWVAEARQGKHPRVQVRMLVDDSADTADVNPPVKSED